MSFGPVFAIIISQNKKKRLFKGVVFSAKNVSLSIIFNSNEVFILWVFFALKANDYNITNIYKFIQRSGVLCKNIYHDQSSIYNYNFDFLVLNARFAIVMFKCNMRKLLF